MGIRRYLMVFFVTLLLSSTTRGVVPNISEELGKGQQLPDYMVGDFGGNYGLNIYFVGTGSVLSSQLLPTSYSDKVYELTTDFAFTPITLRFNFSGYSNWNIGNITIPQSIHYIDFGHSTKTIGQFFVSVNGKLSLVQGSQLDTDGFSISVPHGDHTVALLYINYDETEGIQFASDYVVLRLRKTGETFGEYTTTTVSLESRIDDQRADQLKANITRFTSWFERRIEYQPTTEVDLQLQNFSTELINSEGNIVDNPENGGENVFEQSIFDESQSQVINLVGTTNSSGFTGLQPLGSWTAVAGMDFLFDATGFHPLDTADVVAIREGNNYIGLAALAPYGLWHSKVRIPDGIYSVCTDNVPGIDCSSNIIDWDSEITSIHHDDVNATDIFLDSSFDFLGSMDGQIFFVRFLDSEEPTSEGTEEVPVMTALLLGTLMLIPTIVRWMRREYN